MAVSTLAHLTDQTETRYIVLWVRPGKPDIEEAEYSSLQEAQDFIRAEGAHDSTMIFRIVKKVSQITYSVEMEY